MSRLFYVIIIFLSAQTGLFAQDIIVTNTLDSIECKILKISGDTFHITTLENGVGKNDFLLRSKISFFAVDYKTIPEEVAPPVQKTPSPKYRISIGGGLANLIGRAPSNIPQEFIPYVNELKSGNHFGADICFYESEHVGLGVKYSMFRTTNRLENIFLVDSTGTTINGLLEDDITVQFIGPAIAIRRDLPNGSAHLVSNLSFGYLSYLDNATVIDKIKLSGWTFAFSGEIGLDFEIIDGLHFGVGFGLTLGLIKELDVEMGGVIETLDLSELEYSNPSRFDLGIGLRYFFGKV